MLSKRYIYIFEFPIFQSVYIQNFIPGRHFCHFFSTVLPLKFASKTFHYLYRGNKNTLWESPQGKSFYQIE